MSWPRALVFVRHGESEGNVRSIDERAEFEVATHAYPLTAKGREQARITGEFLHANYPSFDAYYASYYERSKETLRIMCPSAKIYEDPRLAEGQRGFYHSLTQEEVAKRYPDELRRKEREGLYHYRPYGGENWPDIELRIHSFLGTLARDYENEDVLICGHGQWLILFQRLIERFSIEEALARYKKHVVPNASITVYQKSEEWNSKHAKFPKLVYKEGPITPWEGKIRE